MNAVVLPHGFKVLIVEDSITAAMIIEAQINRRAPDLEVRVRRSMRGALEELEKYRPNIILLDLNLPDSTAEETFAMIPALKNRGACVLAMSAESELKARSLTAGADCFMGKAIGEDATPLMEKLSELAPKCTSSP